MQRHPHLALGAYLVGATLILLPLFDASISISPPRFGDVRWRYGASGLLANAQLIPNAGLLLMLLTALSYGHATFRRLLGGLAFIGAALWVVALVMFALDSVQTRAAVRPEMNTSFALASLSAAGKMLVGTATLFVLGLIGVRNNPREMKSPEPAPLFVVDQGLPGGKGR